jgi:hypothetical protein
MSDRRLPSLEAYASGGLGRTFEQVAARVVAQVDAGFRTVKFRAMSDPNTTPALLHYLVPELGGTRFVLDAVQGCASHPWSIDNAIRIGREISARGVCGTRSRAGPRILLGTRRCAVPAVMGSSGISPAWYGQPSVSTKLARTSEAESSRWRASSATGVRALGRVHHSTSTEMARTI